MTFSIDNPRGLQQPPLGKYVWEKPSGEQGLMFRGRSQTLVGWLIQMKHHPKVYLTPFQTSKVKEQPLCHENYS